MAQVENPLLRYVISNLLGPNRLQTLKAGHKRREREGESDACTRILCFWLGFSEILKHNVLGQSISLELQLLPMRTHCMYYHAHWRRAIDSINALQAFYRMPKLFT